MGGPTAEAKVTARPFCSSSLMSVFAHADAADVTLMVLGLVGAIGDGVSMPVMMLIISRIFNDVGSGPDILEEFSSKINENAMNLVLLASGCWAMAFLEGYCWSRTAERQVSRMRARYLAAVLWQDVEYFDLLKAGSTTEVIAGVSNDSLVVQDVLSEKVPNLVMNVAKFLGSYAVGFALLWRLTLVALPSIVLLVIPGFVYGRILMGLPRRIREKSTMVGAMVEQAVSSVRTVYSFAAEQDTMARFSAALEESAGLGVKQGLAKGVAIGSNNGVTLAIWALVVWYGSRLVMYHGYQGGTIIPVSTCIVSGGLALGSALLNLRYLSEASAAGERVLEVIRRVPKIDSGSDTGDQLAHVAGEVEFKSVEFCYPSRRESPVLASFSLRVPAGQTAALVGSSGSGKSTVVALLQRFYDPSAGQVVLDGVDIRRLSLKWLRAQMGLVSQEPVLFATSIRENILMGKKEDACATPEEVTAAAKATNAHDFISQLPDGYDTQVGERGVQMSGGQKQRIAIARAILRSPKILVLDEATSALDSESESVVQEALDLASVGRTTIVVAHRLSTICNADMIAVMQHGAVKEQGSHDDLVADKDSLYSSLVRLHQTRQTNEADQVNGTSVVVQPRSHMTRRLSVASRSSSTRSLCDAGEADKIEEPKLPSPSFKRLLMLNAPEWRHALIGCVSAVVSGGIQPASAWARGSMLSVYFLTDHDEIRDKARAYALSFVALAVLSLLISIVQHYNFGVMGEYLTKRVNERMLMKILTFEIGWFDRDENSSGAICSQLSKDANTVRSLVGDRMSLVIQTVAAVMIARTIGLVIAWRLALVIIVVQPIIIVCFYARRVLLKRMSKKSIKAQSESSKLAYEAVSNVRTITAFSSQDRILSLFNKSQNGPRKESIKQSWIAGLSLGTSLSLTICTFALVFWFGGRLKAEHKIDAKAFFQTYIILVSTGRVIADAASMTTDLAKGADAIASVIAVLDRVTEIDPDNPEGYKPEKLNGAVDIREVDFAYPSRPDVIIFKRFSLSILPGKSTALVGQSGSGKSTIVGLIERFYDPLRGMVMIDGRDIKTYNLRALRQHIGLVSQEPTLFAGTIRENILYGTETANEAEIKNAAMSANAHDFISTLNDGYDTWCGERGVQLSGGQKQCIAIARAILKNPTILLLDEATSALDSRSENVLQEALERVMVGRTSVVVAHRLSTIQTCDLIMVLDKGIVVEKGTHSSLISKGPSGTYYSLVTLQQGGKQEDNICMTIQP